MTPSGQTSSKHETYDENIKIYANFFSVVFLNAYLCWSPFPCGTWWVPTQYPQGITRFKKENHGSFMPCKAWPIKLHATSDISPVKCTVKPKAAGFTRIRVWEEPNVGMM